MSDFLGGLGCRLAAQQFYRPPLLLFGPDAAAVLGGRVELAGPLPPNLHLLTLRQLEQQEEGEGRQLFLQLEHIFQTGEAGQLSSPATVSLGEMFSRLEVTAVRETGLAGNVWLDQMDRLQWSKETNQIGQSRAGPPQPPGWAVTLNPMEIRSFVLHIVQLH